MSAKTIRAVVAGMVLMSALMTTGCGGGGGSPTSPSATPQPSVTTQTGNIDAFGTTRHALTIARSGTMTLRATWLDAAVDLDLFLAASSCSSLYPKASCTILATSEAPTGTAEQVVRSVTTGETFNVFIDNLHPTRAQAYTITVSIQ